jgi:glyoxylase-like metal-dependent hydrolase (beta-lactamase superfamily II)
MIVECFTTGPFEENTYLLGDEGSGMGYVIDPGGSPEPLLEAVARHGLELLGIINTHGHVDHVAGVSALQEKTGLGFAMSEADAFLLEALPDTAAFYGLGEVAIPRIDRPINAGDRFPLGERTIRVRATPGHSPGSVTFLVEDLAFVGDALFAGSIGRTDLPGGDLDVLLESIQGELLILADATTVYAGHGPVTTIGQERRTNPFLR